MPCDSRLRQGQSLAERNAEIKKALAKLEAELAAKKIQVAIANNGGIMFQGWKDRAGISDACAYRVLTAEGSWALRQAVAKAEAMTGKKLNVNAVAGGLHSHDGGKTWGTD
jgi:hypothetical protein